MQLHLNAKHLSSFIIISIVLIKVKVGGKLKVLPTEYEVGCNCETSSSEPHLIASPPLLVFNAELPLLPAVLPMPQTADPSVLAALPCALHRVISRCSLAHLQKGDPERKRNVPATTALQIGKKGTGQTPLSLR